MAPPGTYFDCTLGNTVMVWVKLLDYGKSAPRVFEFSNGNSLDSVLVSVAASIYNFCYPCWSHSTSFQIGVWTHVATSINLNQIIIYINGQTLATGSGNACGAMRRTSCKIGRSDNYPTDTDLNAVLDELKIFNRVLSSAEILTEMNRPQPYEIKTARLINVYAPPSAYTAGLRNYWPFSGDTVDVVNGMDLAIQLNGQFDLDRLGNSNAALYLNQGYATAPAGLYFDCTVGYTAMAWIKLISMGTGNPRIFSFFNSGYNNLVHLYFSASTGQMGTKGGFSTSSTGLTTGIWSHVAFTVISNANIIYINGQQVFNEAYACSAGVATTSCFIGHSDYHLGDSDIIAAIDELKIFNRVLTADQIISEMKMLEPYNKIISN